MTEDIIGDQEQNRPNVLLITIDSLRPDHLGVFGYSRETSPNIDRLASRGKNYKRAYAHGGGTPQAFPTMLAGVPPPTNVQQSDLGLRRGISIVHSLKNLGYVTGAFNSNPFLSTHFGYADDFDMFYHDLKGAVDGRHTFAGGGIAPFLRLITAKPPCVAGADLTKLALSWISKANAPFLAWVHYMDVHMPYLPPTEFVRAIEPKPSNRYYMVWIYRKMYRSNMRVYQSIDPHLSSLTRKDLARIVNYYDGAIRYVDYCIGELLQGLERQQRLQNTLVILTADHGELLGEHGLVDHGYLYDADIHVPLLIAGPGIVSETIDTPVTHLTIQATIENLLFADETTAVRQSNQGFADFKQGIIGSVVDTNRSSFSCRTEDWHYIETFDRVLRKNIVELYDLKSDPSETTNVSGNNPELARRFRDRIAKFVRANQAVKEDSMRGRLSGNEERELRRRLRELGYE